MGKPVPGNREAMPATGVDAAVDFNLHWHGISHGEKAGSSAVETMVFPVFSDRLSASVERCCLVDC